MASLKARMNEPLGEWEGEYLLIQLIPEQLPDDVGNFILVLFAFSRGRLQAGRRHAQGFTSPGRFTVHPF